MNFFRMLGTGLPNVFLRGGVRLDLENDTVSYEALDNLYFVLTRAISRRSGGMNGAELKFLRKRLGMSQQQVGELGQKSEQAAAKWEKGQLSVPLAEAALLRHLWLSRFSPRDLRKAVQAVGASVPTNVASGYFLRFDAGLWLEDTEAVEAANHHLEQFAFTEASSVIDRARGTAYTIDGGAVQVMRVQVQEGAVT